MLACLLPSPSIGWGGDGHRIVCAIAWDDLRPSTRKTVLEILGKDGRDNFADSCNWADAVRPIRPVTAPHHFVNLPREAANVQVSRDCPPERGCVVTAIAEYQAILRDSKDANQRRDALRFLAHYVGDIHQPLHVGYADDMGGNAIKGQFMGKATNLHGVWDFGLLEASGVEWHRMAQRLRSEITPSLRKTWTASTPLDWANESRVANRSPQIGYSLESQGFNFDSGYLNANVPTAEWRLKMAAVRLANLLEETLRQ